ncbi:hypothetical protein EST38_g4314 [Candolleomyces aberdarensis]|uniref:F-box domain-containing protein n=1 Tax=Candolleomyces aberdarensis TaxID=2316362 RepID=A0A4Q2DRC1_9AGAR|nr:hypothetical protein EST38_g4314 [Candolleomyces aberdarensis]
MQLGDTLSPLTVMISHLPEDILLEFIDLLSSDIQTLRSCAQTSNAWAQRCQPYIFRMVSLEAESNPGPRYRKLRDVLEKNPSLADFTHELHLYIGHVRSKVRASCDEVVDINNPELPQFLDRFNQLKQVSIAYSYRSRYISIPETLVEPFAKIFGLESLREATLFDFMHFPISILAHAPYVTNISLYSVDFDTQDPDKTPPTSPSQTPNRPPVRHRAPISLAVKYCPPDIHQVLEELVRERGGLFQYHWIENLVLGPNCNDPE